MRLSWGADHDQSIEDEPSEPKGAAVRAAGAAARTGASRVRFGYRRLAVLLRRRGLAGQRQADLSLYTEDGLAVRINVRKKVARRARVPAQRATRPNEK